MLRGPRAVGPAAPPSRPLVPLPSDHRRRRDGGGLRRAQRGRRAKGLLCQGRRDAVQQPLRQAGNPEAGQDTGRGVPRNDLLGAGVGAGRQPRRHRGAAGRRSHRDGLGPIPWRYGAGPGVDPQPAGLLVHTGHRAGSGRVDREAGAGAGSQLP